MIFDKLLTDEKKIMQFVSDSLEGRTSCLLTYFNQHCFNIYSSDENYRNLIDSKFATYIDGMGIRFALKLFGHKISAPFNASDLNEKLFDFFARKNYSIYLIGGDISEEIIYGPSSNKLNLKGYIKGFFNAEEEEFFLQQITDSKPDVVIVGMGVPKQEAFSEKLSNKINRVSIICVGNFLEFHYGTIKRIPTIFRNLGIEWIFRLFSEPGRLWKRYILGIPLFFYLLVKEYYAVNNSSKA